MIVWTVHKKNKLVIHDTVQISMWRLERFFIINRSIYG